MTDITTSTSVSQPNRPQSDGLINTIMQDRLLAIGEWLDINGEAIYTTETWDVMQEGPIDNCTVRYTKSKSTSTSKHHARDVPAVSESVSTIYAHVLEWPENLRVELASVIPSESTVVTSLALEHAGEHERATCKYKYDADKGLTVELPYYILLKQQHAPYVLRLTNVKSKSTSKPISMKIPDISESASIS
jgi:hypothetical protein